MNEFDTKENGERYRQKLLHTGCSKNANINDYLNKTLISAVFKKSQFPVLKP